MKIVLQEITVFKLGWDISCSFLRTSSLHAVGAVGAYCFGLGDYCYVVGANCFN